MWKLGITILIKKESIFGKKFFGDTCNYLNEDWKIQFPCLFLIWKTRVKYFIQQFSINNQVWELNGCGFFISHTKYIYGN